MPVGVVFQNKHIYENLRLVLDFFYLHFGLRETESGFEKQIYTHTKTRQTRRFLYSSEITTN